MTEITIPEETRIKDKVFDKNTRIAGTLLLIFHGFGLLASIYVLLKIEISYASLFLFFCEALTVWFVGKYVGLWSQKI
jgi:hypothetical protein